MSALERSDAFAREAVEVAIRFAPEEMSSIGFTESDELISDPGEEFENAALAAYRGARDRLASSRAAETDPWVQRDLDMLVASLNDRIDSIEMERRLDVPYLDLALIVFQGLQMLLDETTAPSRRSAASVRLAKYIGKAPGTAPIAQTARRRTEEGLRNPALLAPPRLKVERDLAVGGAYLPGIRALFEEFGIDAKADLDVLESQLAEYEAFVRSEVLPRARDDFRLPPEKYALAMRMYGYSQDPASLADEARAAFAKLQDEASAIAAEIAAERGLRSSDYRAVMRTLRDDQMPEDRVLEGFVERNAQIEAIIRRESIVTLPARELSIRYASEAESAMIPSPYFHPAPLVNNTGERGTFVLPTSIPGEGGEAMRMHDDTSVGISWPLCAHEARPGHELQFSTLATGNVSLTRKVFAMNSVNAEGWGLYSERLIEPFMPPEGRLAVLTMRMMRTARAFLDPELQLGKVTPEEARAFLEREVAISPALALSEVQRYTFLCPAQAPSYYYGYVRLVSLRDDVERALDDRFDQKSFHDFILAQGALSPALLRDAVFAEYVPSREKAAL